MKVFYLLFFFSYSLAFSQVTPTECVEEKKILYQEFIQTDFDDRVSTGLDQVEPVKKLIEDTLKTSLDFIVTDVTVISNAAKVPFYKNKLLIPKSLESTLTFASQRSVFVEQAIAPLKSKPEYQKIQFKTKAQLAGPEYDKLDLNDRYAVKNLTPGYEERVQKLFDDNKELYTQQALITSAKDLLDETKYGNLYLAKFKPFQGFKVIFQGYKISEVKCLDLIQGPVPKLKPTSKQ